MTTMQTTTAQPYRPVLIDGDIPLRDLAEIAVRNGFRLQGRFIGDECVVAMVPLEPGAQP